MRLISRRWLKMRIFTFTILLVSVLFSGCTSLGTGSNYSNVNLWPISTVPWENVLTHIDSAEVVILCLVDDYSQSRLVDSGRRNGPAWFSSQPRANRTPAQMLESYLRGVRSLSQKDLMTPDGTPDQTKMMIYIVENGNKTRERAGELFTHFGVRYYDNSIPVIYMFHRKQLMTTYTYTRSPGANGAKLEAQVSDIFRPK